MLRTWLKAGQVAALALAVSLTGGCAAAAVAGAGAAGGIYLTSQGARGVVNGSVASVADRVPGALSALGVTVTGTSTDNNGASREWTGTKGDLDVHVKVSPETNSTARVEASAKRNPVQWDKDFARQIVSRIVTGS